jgi:hypothetical protein
MGSPKKPSPKQPSPKKNSPKSKRPAITVRQFANEFTARANARREALRKRNEEEHRRRLVNAAANAGSAANAAKMKRISNANNAALRAFFKKATSGTHR